MLVITRKNDESLVIGDNIEITILEISNGKVKIGINAPNDIKIIRKEIIDSIRQTNIDSTVDAEKIDLDELINKISKQKL